MVYKVIILGASGYTGAELVRLISSHPEMSIQALSADRKAGMEIPAVFPHLRHLDLPKLKKISDINMLDADLVFCALPHATSQSVIMELPRELKIVDLSADFRINDTSVYRKWYGKEHYAPDIQKDAVYGLTEFYRAEISEARVVACTGCNAAAGQFALRPLISANAINLEKIIIDLKTGVSGAGRSPKENLLHAELSEGMHAYLAGGQHRHLAEFDQEFSKLAGRPIKVQFTPHLIPANRGILATVYVEGDPIVIYDTLKESYKNEPFIHVLPLNNHPSTRHVRGSNYCHIGVVADRVENRTIVFSALDNLTKGSSGQALQNANLMLGCSETTGLLMAPIFP